MILTTILQEQHELGVEHGRIVLRTKNDLPLASLLSEAFDAHQLQDLTLYFGDEKMFDVERPQLEHAFDDHLLMRIDELELPLSANTPLPTTIVLHGVVEKRAA